MFGAAPPIGGSAFAARPPAPAVGASASPRLPNRGRVPPTGLRQYSVVEPAAVRVVAGRRWLRTSARVSFHDHILTACLVLVCTVWNRAAVAYLRCLSLTEQPLSSTSEAPPALSTAPFCRQQGARYWRRRITPTGPTGVATLVTAHLSQRATGVPGDELMDAGTPRRRGRHASRGSEKFATEFVSALRRCSSAKGGARPEKLSLKIVPARCRNYIQPFVKPARAGSAGTTPEAAEPTIANDQDARALTATPPPDRAGSAR